MFIHENFWRNRIFIEFKSDKIPIIFINLCNTKVLAVPSIAYDKLKSVICSQSSLARQRAAFSRVMISQILISFHQRTPSQRRAGGPQSRRFTALLHKDSYLHSKLQPKRFRLTPSQTPIRRSSGPFAHTTLTLIV